MTVIENNRESKTKDYFKSLEEWYDQYRIFSNSCNFGSIPDISVLPPPPSSTLPLFTPLIQQQIPNNLGGVFKIAPLWKRFVAEIIDFGILFFIKMNILLMADDYFEFIDVESLMLKSDDLSHKMAQFTRELLILEIIHRVIVCIYEGYALAQRSPDAIGGATVGKTFMGLRVVACRELQVVPGTDNMVHVIPATTLSFMHSFLRAALKNVALLAFTAIFPIMFNRYNRAGYDVICGSIVVEDSPAINLHLRGR